MVLNSYLTYDFDMDVGWGNTYIYKFSSEIYGIAYDVCKYNMYYIKLDSLYSSFIVMGS